MRLLKLNGVMFFWLAAHILGCVTAPKHNLESAPTSTPKLTEERQTDARVNTLSENQNELWFECARLISNGELEQFKSRGERCLNVRSISGMTPLMFTIYKRQDSFFDFLMKNQNIHAVDLNGDNALFYAVMSGRMDYIKNLREQDARIQLNDLQVSPLWVALQNAPAEIIFALNPNWIEVNLRGSDGWNALYFAIRRREESVFDFILKVGSETEIRDSENQSPLDFAREEVGWDYAVQRLQR